MASILPPSNSPGNDSLIGSPDKNQELASTSNANSTPINLPNFSVKIALFKVIYVWGGIWHYWYLISEKAWIQSHSDSHGSDYLSGCPDENQELSEYVIDQSCCSEMITIICECQQITRKAVITNFQWSRMQSKGMHALCIADVYKLQWRYLAPIHHNH